MSNPTASICLSCVGMIAASGVFRILQRGWGRRARVEHRKLEGRGVIGTDERGAPSGVARGAVGAIASRRTGQRQKYCWISSLCRWTQLNMDIFSTRAVLWPRICRKRSPRPHSPIVDWGGATPPRPHPLDRSRLPPVDIISGYATGSPSPDPENFSIFWMKMACFDPLWVWNTVLKLMCLLQKASHQTSMHRACRLFVKN